MIRARASAVEMAVSSGVLLTLNAVGLTAIAAAYGAGALRPWAAPDLVIGLVVAAIWAAVLFFGITLLVVGLACWGRDCEDK